MDGMGKYTIGRYAKAEISNVYSLPVPKNGEGDSVLVRSRKHVPNPYLKTTRLVLLQMTIHNFVVVLVFLATLMFVVHIS